MKHEINEGFRSLYNKIFDDRTVAKLVDLSRLTGIKVSEFEKWYNGKEEAPFLRNCCPRKSNQGRASGLH